MPGTGPSSINRINRQRQVTLTGNVLAGGSQAAILSKLEQCREDLGMEPGYTFGRHRHFQGTGAAPAITSCWRSR